MVKRFREDVSAAARMRFLLEEIKKLSARDTAKESSDLLRNASLLVREEAPEDDDEGDADDVTDDECEVQVKGGKTISVSNFLRSQLPKYSRPTLNRIVAKLRSPYSRKLSAAKHEELKIQNKRAIAHVNLNKPTITYFESDLPLMIRVLAEMDAGVKTCIRMAFEEAVNAVIEMRPGVGLVF